MNDFTVNVCVKVLIQVEQFFILLLRKETNYIEPIGGRLEIDFSNKKSESPIDSLHRECLEETGIFLDKQQLKFIGCYDYFWSTQPNKYSFCLLYISKHTFTNFELEQVLKFNGVEGELRLCSFKDILNEAICFNPKHKGLEALVRKCILSNSKT